MKQPHPGRPRMEPRPRETMHLSVRVGSDLRRKLQREAERLGRPLSEVVDKRLGASFRDETLLQEAQDRIYGSQVSRFLMRLGLIAREVASGTRPPGTALGETDHLFANAKAFNQFATAVIATLDDCRPAGDPAYAAADLWTVPSGSADWDTVLVEQANRVGKDVANRMAEDLRDPVKRQSGSLAPIAAALDALAVQRA